MCIILLEIDPLTLLHVTAFSAVMFNFHYFDRVVQNGRVLNYSVFYITASFLFYHCRDCHSCHRISWQIQACHVMKKPCTMIQLRKTALCVKGKFYFSHSWKRCSHKVFPVTLLACFVNLTSYYRFLAT